MVFVIFPIILINFDNKKAFSVQFSSHHFNIRLELTGTRLVTVPCDLTMKLNFAVSGFVEFLNF